MILTFGSEFRCTTPFTAHLKKKCQLAPYQLTPYNCILVELHFWLYIEHSNMKPHRLLCGFIKKKCNHWSEIGNLVQSRKFFSNFVQQVLNFPDTTNFFWRNLSHIISSEKTSNTETLHFWENGSKYFLKSFLFLIIAKQIKIFRSQLNRNRHLLCLVATIF